MVEIDDLNRKILALLQRNAALTADEISERVALSRNAVWRRIRQMEEAGIITGRVALVDPVLVGQPLLALVLVRTNRHDPAWLQSFQSTLCGLPEVVAAYRMTGDLDYVLKVRLADVPAYDAFYKRLTSRIDVSDISASFVMEQITETTAIPV